MSALTSVQTGIEQGSEWKVWFFLRLKTFFFCGEEKVQGVVGKGFEKRNYKVASAVFCNLNSNYSLVKVLERR